MAKNLLSSGVMADYFARAARYQLKRIRGFVIVEKNEMVNEMNTIKSLAPTAVLFLALSLAPLAAFGARDTAGADAANAGSHLNPVPFIVQAPLGDWSWPWQDFCEEASVAMTHFYLEGKVPTVPQAAVSLLRLAIFEMKTFGYEKDTGLADTERMIREYYGHAKTRIVENPSADFIRGEVEKGNVVLVPAAGKLLKNPYFKTDPRYHMVLVKGYEAGDFIVNEPGTWRGDGFRYTERVLMDAMHDLAPGDITNGRKAALVVEKS